MSNGHERIENALDRYKRRDEGGRRSKTERKSG